MSVSSRIAFLLLGLSVAPLVVSQGLPTDLRHVAVTGHGEVEAEADRARVTFTAMSTRPTSTEAKRDVDDTVNDLLDALESQGIGRDDILASGINLNPEYEYARNVREFRGFRATRMVSVVLHDLDGLNALLDGAVGAQVDAISSIALESSRADEHRAEARTRAIADSKSKALLLAEAYGSRLGPVYSISYQQPQPLPMERTMVMAEAAQVAGPAGRPGQYFGHTVTFSDQISVVFMLVE